jgi:hypothetical protein
MMMISVPIRSAKRRMPLTRSRRTRDWSQSLLFFSVGGSRSIVA